MFSSFLIIASYPEQAFCPDTLMNNVKCLIFKFESRCVLLTPAGSIFRYWKYAQNTQKNSIT
jgi:hypothetical protein